MLTSMILAQIVPYIVTALVAAAITWIAATSDRLAEPARAKPEADRTLRDRAAIKADDFLDAQLAALDRQQLQEFLTNFVLQNLGAIKASGAPADELADALADAAGNALQRRNPTMAARASLGRKSLTELLAAKINEVIVMPKGA